MNFNKSIALYPRILLMSKSLMLEWISLSLALNLCFPLENRIESKLLSGLKCRVKCEFAQLCVIVIIASDSRKKKVTTEIIEVFVHETEIKWKKNICKNRSLVFLFFFCVCRRCEKTGDGTRILFISILKFIERRKSFINGIFQLFCLIRMMKCNFHIWNTIFLVGWSDGRNVNAWSAKCKSRGIQKFAWTTTEIATFHMHRESERDIGCARKIAWWRMFAFSHVVKYYSWGFCTHTHTHFKINRIQCQHTLAHSHVHVLFTQIKKKKKKNVRVDQQMLAQTFFHCTNVALA